MWLYECMQLAEDVSDAPSQVQQGCHKKSTMLDSMWPTPCFVLLE